MLLSTSTLSTFQQDFTSEHKCILCTWRWKCWFLCSIPSFSCTAWWPAEPLINTQSYLCYTGPSICIAVAAGAAQVQRQIDKHAGSWTLLLLLLLPRSGVRSFPNSPRSRLLSLISLRRHLLTPHPFLIFSPHPLIACSIEQVFGRAVCLPSIWETAHWQRRAAHSLLPFLTTSPSTATTAENQKYRK